MNLRENAEISVAMVTIDNGYYSVIRHAEGVGYTLLKKKRKYFCQIMEKKYFFAKNWKMEQFHNFGNFFSKIWKKNFQITEIVEFPKFGNFFAKLRKS